MAVPRPKQITFPTFRWIIANLYLSAWSASTFSAARCAAIASVSSKMLNAFQPGLSFLKPSLCSQRGRTMIPWGSLGSSLVCGYLSKLPSGFRGYTCTKALMASRTTCSNGGRNRGFVSKYEVRVQRPDMANARKVDLASFLEMQLMGEY